MRLPEFARSTTFRWTLAASGAFSLAILLMLGFVYLRATAYLTAANDRLLQRPYVAAGNLMDAIVRELKKSGKFTLPSFGTFTVRKTKARKGLNPRTGEAIKVKDGKTVRFKASPTLKKNV